MFISFDAVLMMDDNLICRIVHVHYETALLCVANMAEKANNLSIKQAIQFFFNRQ